MILVSILSILWAKVSIHIYTKFFWYFNTTTQYTPAYSPFILRSLFCGILLEGLEKSGLKQSPIRHLTRSAYRTIPILGFKNRKVAWSSVGTVYGVCENFNFYFSQKFSDNGTGVWLSTFVMQKLIFFSNQVSSCSHVPSGFLKFHSSTAHWLSYDEVQYADNWFSHIEEQNEHNLIHQFASWTVEISSACFLVLWLHRNDESSSHHLQSHVLIISGSS